MPRGLFNTKMQKAKSLAVLANESLLQKTACGNTQPFLL